MTKQLHFIKKIKIYLFLSGILCFSSCALEIPGSKSVPPASGRYDKHVTDQQLTACQHQKDMMKKARLYLKKKKYRGALKLVSDILKEPCNREDNYSQALAMAGDIFLLRGEIRRSFLFYAECLNSTTDRDYQSNIIKKIAAAANYISVKKIPSLLSKINKKELQGQVLFETGSIKFKNNDFASAEKLLKLFLQHHKKHHKMGRVVSILSTIRERGVFQKNSIGVLLPLSGFYKNAGERALRAISLAVDEFNQMNSGKKFILHVKDSMSDPDHAVRQINILKQEKVSCIIGPMVTAFEAAVASERLKIPMMALSQQQGIPFIGDYIFRNYLTPQLQIKSTLSYLIENYNVKKFAILFPNEKYGHVFSRIFEEMVSFYQYDITDRVMYEPDQTDFSNQILMLIHGYKRMGSDGNIIIVEDHREKLRNKPYRALIDFEVLFIPDTISKLTTILPQLRYHDIDGVIVTGTNLLDTERPLEMRDIDPPQIIFPSGFNRKAEDASIQRFISSYNNRYQQHPEYIEAASYETAWILMQSLVQPEVGSPEDLIHTLKERIYLSSVGCQFSFSGSGEAVRNLYLFNLQKDGKSIIVQSCGNPAF